MQYKSDAAQAGSWLANVGMKVSTRSGTELVGSTAALFCIRSLISSRRCFNRPIFSITRGAPLPSSRIWLAPHFLFKMTASSVYILKWYYTSEIGVSGKLCSVHFQTTSPASPTPYAAVVWRSVKNMKAGNIEAPLFGHVLLCKVGTTVLRSAHDASRLAQQ